MNKSNISRPFIIILFFMVVGSAIVSCQPESATAISAETTVTTMPGDPPESGEQIDPGKTVTQPSEDVETTDEVETTTEDTVSVEEQPNFTPTPDLRLKPEEWREWPVVPILSPNAAAIYQNGIALGRDPTRFSKIGDCQSIKEVLLGIYDLPGRYTLLEEDQYLQATIDQFTGSFNRDGMAVRGGFNAATVLSPIWADPESCEPGENPIQCEYRVHQPTIAIISLEVWWDGRSPERYEEYMRRIIEYSIEQGVVPILSTKADNVEGDHSINLTTAKLAYEYDIPLWNFWLAVQDLPNQGIDPDRDGFHISVDAWNRRSFTALQTIHAVYEAGNAQIPQPEEETEQTEEQILTPVISNLEFSPAEFPPYDMDGTIYFELTETIDGQVLPAGIYKLVLQEGLVTQVFPPGAEIISENINQGFIVSLPDVEILLGPGGKQTELKGFDFTNQTVYMLNENEFLTFQSDLQYPLSPAYGVIDESGTISVAYFELPELVGEITAIYFATKDYLIGSTGNCEDECRFYIFHNYLMPKELSFLEYPAFEHPLIQPATDTMAFWRNINGTDSLYLSDLQGEGSEQYLGLYGNIFLDQTWQNSNNILAAIKMERSNYYGKATDILHYVIDANTNIIKEYPAIIGLNPSIIWSPDSQYLATVFTQINEQEESSIVLRIINTINNKAVILDSELGMQSDTFIAVKNFVWFNN